MQEGRGLYRWGELDTLSASSSDSSASSWPQPPRPTQQQRVSPANPWDRFLLPGPHQDQPRKGGGDNSSSSWQIWSSGEQEQEWGSSSRAGLCVSQQGRVACAGANNVRGLRLAGGSCSSDHVTRPFRPVQIGGDEGGGKVHGTGELPLPIADQLLLELIEPQRWPRQPIVLLHRAGEGGAEGGAIGAGADEAGAVGGVLHRIGEGQHPIVAIEGGGVERGAPGAGEIGGR